MRRIVAGLALALLVASTAFAAPRSATPWTVLWNNDGITGYPYWECPVQPGMGENDDWTFIAEGTLSGTFEVTNPRPTCMGMVARAAFRWLGNGKAPVVSLEIVDPTGAVTPNAYSVTRIVTEKQGKPTWVQLCFENSNPDHFGTYRFRVTGNAAIRFGANVMPHEMDYQGCNWWPSQLGNWGL